MEESHNFFMLYHILFFSYFIFIWVVLNNNYINKKLIKIKILCMNFIFKNIYKIFLKHYNSNGLLFRKIVFFKTAF